MSIQAATPYFILGGNASDAVEFYQRALDATVSTVQRFGDVDRSCPAAMKDRIMHAELRAGGAVLMLSDGPEGDAPVSPGRVSVALALDDEAQARRYFDALGASGGSVTQPLIDAPWGALFGAVLDRFGINWMFNCAKK